MTGSFCLLTFLLFFLGTSGDNAQPHITPDFSAGELCHEAKHPCSTDADCCKGLHCFWGKDFTGKDPRIQRTCLSCKDCDFKLNECSAMCPNLKQPQTTGEVSQKKITPLDKFRPSTTPWPIHKKQRHEMRVTFLNDYADVIGTKKDEFLKACASKFCTEVAAMPDARLQIEFKHVDLNLLFSLAAEFKEKGFNVPGFVNLKGADIEGLPTTLNPLCNEVAIVRDENFVETGKDCPTAWKITKKLLPDLTECPPALLAQCPKTCGHCPGTPNYSDPINAPNGEGITTDFKFPTADYKLLIGDRKAEFLKECSEVLKPVKCLNAIAGSVIITVFGQQAELEQSVDGLSKSGLQLPNFGNFGDLFDPQSLKKKIQNHVKEPPKAPETSSAVKSISKAKEPKSTSTTSVKAETTSRAEIMTSKAAETTAAAPETTSKAAETTAEVTSAAAAAEKTPQAETTTTTAAETTKESTTSLTPAPLDAERLPKTVTSISAKKESDDDLGVLKMKQVWAGQSDCGKLRKLVIDVNAIAFKVDGKAVKATCHVGRRSLFIKDVIDLFKDQKQDEDASMTMNVEVTMSKGTVEKMQKTDEADVQELLHHALRKHENIKKQVHLKSVKVEGSTAKAKKAQTTTDKPETTAEVAKESTTAMKTTKAVVKKKTTPKATTTTSKAPTTTKEEETTTTAVVKTVPPEPWIGPENSRAPWDDGSIPDVQMKPPKQQQDLLSLLNGVQASYTFQRSYSKLIGNNSKKKQKFMKECGEKLSPVKCVDVIPAEKENLIIKFQGNRAEFSLKSKIFYETGLKLPSFGNLGVGSGLLPSVMVHHGETDETVTKTTLPPFCEDVEEVLDENGKSTGHDCKFAKAFVKKHLKTDTCVPQLAKQCPVTCGTCETGAKKLNPEAENAPERIVRIVEKFESFSECGQMAKSVREINAKALDVTLEMVYVRLGKGCEQVSQSMHAYLEMGVHRRRLIDTAQFVVEIVFPASDAIKAKALAHTPREKIKTFLNNVIGQNEALKDKTVVSSVTAPTLDVCIDAAIVKDEYDKETGETCEKVVKALESKECYPHIAIQCPQACGVCMGPTTTTGKPTLKPTTTTTSGKPTLKPTMKTTTGKPTLKPTNATTSGKPTLKPTTTTTTTAKPTLGPTTTTTAKAPKPVVLFVQATFEGLKSCEKGKDVVQKVSAKVLGVKEKKVKIQKCQKENQISKFDSEDRRQLLMGNLFKKKQHEQNKQKVKAKQQKSDKVKDEIKQEEGKEGQKKYEGTYQKDEPKGSHLPVVYLLNVETVKEKAKLDGAKIVKSVNAELQKQHAGFKMKKFEVLKNGFPILTTMEPKAETTAAGTSTLSTESTKLQTTNVADTTLEPLRTSTTQKVTQKAATTSSITPLLGCKDVEGHSIRDARGEGTGNTCEQEMKFMKDKLNKTKCDEYLVKQCPVTCGFCSPSKQSVKTTKSAKCEDTTNVVDESGVETGYSCSKARAAVEKLLPKLQEEGCPEQLAKQCPKTCGKCLSQAKEDFFKLKLEVDFKKVIQDKEKDFLDICRSIHNGINFQKVTESDAHSAILWINAAKPKQIADFLTEVLDDELKIDGFGEFKTSVSPVNDEAEAELALEGNFDKIVNSDKKRARFIAECTVKLFPVVCMDVYAGSVKVKIAGEHKLVKAVHGEVAEYGLNLESFPALAPKDKTATNTTQEDSSKTSHRQQSKSPTQSPVTTPKPTHASTNPSSVGQIVIFEETFEGVKDCESMERRIAYLNSEVFQVDRKRIQVFSDQGCDEKPSLGVHRRELSAVDDLIRTLKTEKKSRVDSPSLASKKKPKLLSRLKSYSGKNTPYDANPTVPRKQGKLRSGLKSEPSDLVKTPTKEKEPLISRYSDHPWPGPRGETAELGKRGSREDGDMKVDFDSGSSSNRNQFLPQFDAAGKPFDNDMKVSFNARDVKDNSFDRPELLESGTRSDRLKPLEKEEDSALKSSSVDDKAVIKSLLPLDKPILPKLDEKPHFDDAGGKVKSFLPTMDKLTSKIEDITSKKKQSSDKIKAPWTRLLSQIQREGEKDEKLQKSLPKQQKGQAKEKETTKKAIQEAKKTIPQQKEQQKENENSKKVPVQATSSTGSPITPSAAAKTTGEEKEVTKTVETTGNPSPAQTTGEITSTKVTTTTTLTPTKVPTTTSAPTKVPTTTSTPTKVPTTTSTPTKLPTTTTAPTKNPLTSLPTDVPSSSNPTKAPTPTTPMPTTSTTPIPTTTPPTTSTTLNPTTSTTTTTTAETTHQEVEGKPTRQREKVLQTSTLKADTTVSVQSVDSTSNTKEITAFQKPQTTSEAKEATSESTGTTLSVDESTPSAQVLQKEPVDTKAVTTLPPGTTVAVKKFTPPGQVPQNQPETTKTDTTFPPEQNQDNLTVGAVRFRVELFFPDTEVDQGEAVAKMTKVKVIKRFNEEIDHDYRVRGKIKMVDTSHGKVLKFESRETLTFIGRFSEIVGEERPLFLNECSKALAPVKCIDVYPGSIKVDVVGKKAEVDAVVTSTKANGLKLSSFPSLIHKEEAKTLQRATTAPPKKEKTTKKVETTKEAKETTKEVKTTTTEATLKARVEFKTKFRGTSKAFLAECSNELSPVKCTDMIRKDASIEVDLSGLSDEDLAKKLHGITIYGLNLDSYGDFPKGTVLQMPETVSLLMEKFAKTTLKAEGRTPAPKTTNKASQTTGVAVLKKLQTTTARASTREITEAPGEKDPAVKELTPGPMAGTGFPVIEKAKKKQPKWTICQDVEDVKTNKGLLSGRTCVQAWDALRRFKTEITECPQLLKEQCPFTCHECLSRQLLKFDKNFQIVSGKEKQFLERCSEIASPVNCVDVKKGSIIVTLEGKSDELKEKVDTFVNHGLKIEGFGELGHGMKVTPQISGAAPRMPDQARDIIMQAMKSDEKQSVAPAAVASLLLARKVHVTTITKALFALGITPMDAELALEDAGIDAKTITQALHSLGAPQIPKKLLPQIQALKKKEKEILPSSVISALQEREKVSLVMIARVLIAVGVDPAVAIKALKKAKFGAREVMAALDDVSPDDPFSPLKKGDNTEAKQKAPITTTSAAPSKFWTVSFTFKKIRDCKRKAGAGAIQLSEIRFGDGSKSRGRCNGTTLATVPSHTSADYDASNLCDGRDSKWVDETMKDCSNSLKLSGFSFTKKPTHYLFKTADNFPARDPEVWEVEVCNGESCRKAFVHERLPENRLKHSQWLSLELLIISVKIEGLPSEQEIEIMNNHNERKDMLRFDRDGVKQFEYSVIKGSDFNVEIVQTPSNVRCTMANGGGVAHKDQYVSIYCSPEQSSDFVFGIRVLKTKGCEVKAVTDAVSFSAIDWLNRDGRPVSYATSKLGFEPKKLQGDLGFLSKRKGFTSLSSKNSGCDGSIFMYGWHFSEAHAESRFWSPTKYRIKTGHDTQDLDMLTWELQRCEGQDDSIGVLAKEKKSLKGGNCRKAIIEEELPKQRSHYSQEFSAELFTVSVDMKGWKQEMGVVLTNNHDVRGDALTIEKNGISTFEYSLVKGARYGIALKKITKGFICEADGWGGRISADVIIPVTCKKETSKRKENEVAGLTAGSKVFQHTSILVGGFLVACIAYYSRQKQHSMPSESVHLLSEF